MEGRETRKFYLMRHGERLDYVFGDWMSQCFDKHGDYFPTNLNMPDTVPKRPQGHHVHIHDPPLTKTGIFQAQLTGEAFKKAQLDVSHVYCSPSLRCIQTCDAFLKGCSKKSEIKIRVEPGLYEWWVLFGDRLPDWLTPKELYNTYRGSITSNVLAVPYCGVIVVRQMEISGTRMGDIFAAQPHS
ncbi:ecdysteroid-phosphate phosphatase-like [Zophobas morio]